VIGSVHVAIVVGVKAPEELIGTQENNKTKVALIRIRIPCFLPPKLDTYYD
jgi:hypothetical protein